MKKPILFALVAAVIVVTLYLLARNPVDLEMLRAELDGLDRLRAARPLLVVAVFFAVYVAVAALSLPLALWETG